MYIYIYIYMHTYIYIHLYRRIANWRDTKGTGWRKKVAILDNALFQKYVAVHTHIGHF